MPHEILELWPNAAFETPSRSRLFALEPLGQGTPEQEALSSYMVRLARAHSVLPLDLCNRELLPVTQIKRGFSVHKFIMKDAKTLNGLNKYAMEASRGFHQLTGRNDLEFCTLLPWQDVLDRKSIALLHPHPRWCPACFIEWRAKSREPYWLLLWFLSPATQCPTHGKMLEEVCPHCGRHQPFIPRHSHMDYCSHCGQSLAFLAEAVNPRSEFAGRWQSKFCSQAMAEMIVEGSRAHGYATQQRLSERIGDLVRILGRGNPAEMHRRLGLRDKATDSWRRDGEHPTIQSLLTLCYRIGLTPVQFLQDAVPETLEPREKVFLAPKLSSRQLLSKRERARIQSVLMNAIADPCDSPSLMQLAKRLGYSKTFLYYWWREECTAISQKHAQFLRLRSETRLRTLREKVADISREIFATSPNAMSKLILVRVKAEKITLAWPEVRKVIQAVRQEFGMGRQNTSLAG